MCTVVALVPLLTLAAAGAGMAAQESGAAAQRGMAEYQAQSAQAQAQTAQYEAGLARQQAQQDADAIRRNFLRSQGTQRSLLAVSGATMSDGSALDVLLDNASQARKDQEARLYQGELAAWRAENRVQSLLGDSDTSLMRAGAAGVSGWDYVQRGSSLSSGLLSS